MYIFVVEWLMKRIEMFRTTDREAACEDVTLLSHV